MRCQGCSVTILHDIVYMSNLAINGPMMRERMRTVRAADAKNKFGELVDMARTAPLAITKYGRTVLIVLAFEEYERLKRLDASNAPAQSSIDEADH